MYKSPKQLGCDGVRLWSVFLIVVSTSLCAEAGSVSNLQITNLSGPNIFEDNPQTGVKREALSSTSLLSSNLGATMPNFSARLAGLAVCDLDLPAMNHNAAVMLQMRITFDITALPTESWTIDIGQLRNLALTLVDDAPLAGFPSEAYTDFHTATYALSPGGSGNLQFPSSGSEIVSIYGSTDVPINQSVSDSLAGSGSTSVQLDFRQLIDAISFANDDPLYSAVAPGQEGAVRFGMLGSLTGVTADDYPGVGARVVADDGHFVNVKVTFVPEPASALLLVIGLGLSIRRVRKLSL